MPAAARGLLGGEKEAPGGGRRAIVRVLVLIRPSQSWIPAGSLVGSPEQSLGLNARIGKKGFP